MDATAASPRLYLDSVIRARRSLSRHGVITLMSLLVAINLLFAAFFFSIGGLFVPPFLGLDVLGVGLALWFSFRGAKGVEHVRISADEIAVLREGGRRSEIVWVSRPQFTRVGMVKTGRHARRLFLASRGQAVALGDALSVKERARFMGQIEAALTAAKSERW